jgi:hypothetical protein
MLIGGLFAASTLHIFSDIILSMLTWDKWFAVSFHSFILFWIQLTFVTVISNCSNFDMLKDLFVVYVMILSCIMVV